MPDFSLVEPVGFRAELDKLPRTIHQLSDRSWSSSVPSRDPADPRVELRGWDDPEDETNGVTGRENITDLDVWLDLNEFGIAPPWES